MNSVANPSSNAAPIKIINTAPRQPNDSPKMPYFGSESCGNRSESNTAISPISGENNNEIINAQPKPILRRLPNRPIRASTPTPNTTAQIRIGIITPIFWLSLHSVICSEWQLLACAVGEEQLAKLLLLRSAKGLAHECACNG